jgi:hypothetical protein
MSDLDALLERLCRVSVGASGDLCAGCDWPQRIAPHEWCMSPELISLHGTAVYASLDEAQARRLSLYEAVNFFSLNIHGERALVAGIAERLDGRGGDSVSRYLQHFLAEETRHMALFAQFCRRYAGKVYREKKFALPRAYAAGEAEFLFFARVLVFEEIVDGYNCCMAGDRRLAAIARQINRLHHRDESRHLAFGRHIVAQLFEQHAPHWSASELDRVRAELSAYFGACWSEYCNPDAYRDAGLGDPYAARALALGDAARRQHRAAFSAAPIAYLREHGILTAEPAL